jgi:hypothetical protein
MVLALLAGTKTQTRRFISNQPSIQDWAKHVALVESKIEGQDLLGWVAHDWYGVPKTVEKLDWLKPYALPGDIFWVREACRAEELPVSGFDGVRYMADGKWIPIQDSVEAADAWGKLYWYRGVKGHVVPPIHMPRWATRLILKVKTVRVERLKTISEKDARAEGVSYDYSTRTFPRSGGAKVQRSCARDSFIKLWDELHGQKGPKSWDANPWVWVVEFETVGD